jgi:hypothetical protein
MLGVSDSPGAQAASEIAEVCQESHGRVEQGRMFASKGVLSVAPYASHRGFVRRRDQKSSS